MIRFPSINVKRRPDSEELRAFRYLVVALTALGSLGFQPYGGFQFWLSLSLLGYSVIAFVIRSGWLIPCLLLGIMIGVWLDPSVKGGTAESKIQETEESIYFGAGCGMLIGLISEIMSFAKKDPNVPLAPP